MEIRDTERPRQHVMELDDRLVYTNCNLLSLMSILSTIIPEIVTTYMYELIYRMWMWRICLSSPPDPMTASFYINFFSQAPTVNIILRVRLHLKILNLWFCPQPQFLTPRYSWRLFLASNTYLMLHRFINNLLGCWVALYILGLFNDDMLLKKSIRINFLLINEK
jgi:hypothetical protein